MLTNGTQSSQLLPMHISEQIHSSTVGEGRFRLAITSPEANRLSKRTEYSPDRNVLQHLNMSVVQPLKDLLKWLISLLGRGGDAQGLSKDLSRQHAELAGQAPTIGHRVGNSFKTVLDTVGLLTTSSKVNQKLFDVTLQPEQINVLQGAIIEGNASFKDIENMVETRGDLQLVRTLALSLSHDTDSQQPSIKTALANLATGRPNTSVFLSGVTTFLEDQEVRWEGKNANNSELRWDAQAQNDFISEQLQEHISELNTHEAHNILEQLEGHFGQRAHGVMGLASELLGLADDNDQLLSRLTRAEGLTDNLISLLRVKLGMAEVDIPGSPSIDSLNQLNPLEQAVLVKLGIKLQ